MDGNGFALTSAKEGASFDFSGNGAVELASWTHGGSDNAWLVLDRNGNGTIDSGKELFGNYTLQPPSRHPNGFLALAELDDPSNGGDGDGWITHADSMFSELRLWKDLNHDGISQPAELITLEQAGVTGISVNYTTSKWTDQFGNQFRYRSEVRRAENSKVARYCYDVILSFPH